jgi:hypothetical protein
VLVLSKKSTTKIQPQVYTVKFETNTPDTKPTSKIKIMCNCPQFRYRQAYCFYKKDALFSKSDFVIDWEGQEIKPDKTNPGCKNFGPCKHIKAALKYCVTHNI